MAFTNAQKFVSLGMSPDLATVVSDAATAVIAEKPEIAALVSLTDNSGGTATDTLEDCNNAVTGVDGTGSNAASKADVDARLVSIANNLADLSAKVNAVIAALQA